METNKNDLWLYLSTLLIVVLAIGIWFVGPDTFKKPDPAKDLVVRSAMAYNRGDYIGCIQTATDALKLKKEYADAYNNRAVCYLGLKDYDKAEADALHGLKINDAPMNPKLHANLAWIRDSRARAGR